MTLVSLSESDTINKIAPEVKPQRNNINDISIEALIHLINTSSEEVRRYTETLKASKSAKLGTERTYGVGTFGKQ